MHVVWEVPTDQPTQDCIDYLIKKNNCGWTTTCTSTNHSKDLPKSQDLYKKHCT